VARIGFSDGLAIGGFILAILLIVLDKAGKLRGPMLLCLLAVAAAMAIPLCFSIPWVSDALPGVVSFSRKALMIFLLGSLWAGIAAWITSGNPDAETSEKALPEAPVVKLIEPLGFVQFEKRDLELPTLVLQSGQSMRMKFTFANRGLVPVYDVQSWGVMLVLNRKANDIIKTKEIFHQSVATGYEKFKGSGSTLGIGIENFNYAPLNNGHLTEEDITHLKSKDWNLYFIAVGGWRNTVGTPGFWIQCEWAEFPESLDISTASWHTC
jgi:hypothetical protein